MINPFYQIFYQILIGVVVGIILAIIFYIFRREVLGLIVSSWYYIVNKDIDIGTFSLSIVYDENFNIDSLKEIGRTFSGKGFDVTFVDEYQYMLNNIFSYKIIFRPSFALNDSELEDLPNSMEVLPQSRKFSYRTGLDDLAQELSTIVQTLSQLGRCEYYMNIVLDGKKKRIHLNNTNRMASEVRKSASSIVLFRPNSGA